MEIKHILRAVGLSLPSESEGKWRGGPRSLRLGQERLLVTLRVSPLHPSIRAQPTAVRNLPESTLGWNADLCLCTPVCMCSGMLHLLAGAGVRAHRWLCEGQENVSLMYICGPRGFVKVVFFFFGCVGSSLLHAASGGYSSLRSAGFSLRWLLLLWSTGSRRAGLRNCGTWAPVVVARRL